MKRLLVAFAVCALLAVGRPAVAQTTTSTSSSSTSTSTTLVLSWACNRDFNYIAQPGPYVAVGHCTGTGAYQNGGATLGSAATAKATAQALCGSGYQTVVDFLKTDVPASGVPPALCTFSLTTFLYQCFTTIGSEMNTGNTTPSPFDYVAYCK